MAKTTKIIASLLATSALWLGGTDYISSNTKSQLDAYITKSNTMYKANGMQVSIENFEKGFFSSNAKMKIDFLEPSLRESVSKTLKLPIEVDYHIENGPLFFDEGLGFGASRISTNVNLSDYFVDKEAFNKIFKEEVILTSNTSIDFAKNASFLAKTNKIVATNEGDEIHISALKIEGEMNVETFKGQIKIFIDSVVAENKTDAVNLKNIVLDADIKKFYDNGLYLGDFVFLVDSVDMKDELLPFELKGAKIALDMNIDENKDKTIDMKFKFKGDVGESKLPKEYSSLKEVEFSYALNGTKLEGLLAFQDFTQNLQTKQQDILSRLQSPTTGELDKEVLVELEKMQIKTREDMIMSMAGLLKKDSTNFEIEMIMTDKEARSSNLKMNIGYVGDEVLPTSYKELEEKFTKEFLNLLSLNFTVNLEKDYISNLPEQSQQELATQLQMGKMFGIVKENNNSFSFDADYKDKRLMLNGKDSSEMLQMLETGLSQGNLF